MNEERKKLKNKVIIVILFYLNNSTQLKMIEWIYFHVSRKGGSPSFIYGKGCFNCKTTKESNSGR